MKREKYLKKLSPPPKWEPFSPPVDYFSGAVVIPLCNEINFLPATLNSLPPDETVMILLVINHSRNASERVKEANCQTLSLLRSQEIIPEVWRKRCFFFDCGAIDGGVGAARKIGMDAAIGVLREPDGILWSLDGDTLVEDNYFSGVRQFFQEHPELGGCSLQVRHQKAENEHLQRAIEAYERYLYDYSAALRQAGSPYAPVAVGSALAATVQGYIHCGGMRVREAGEDFYFLQALIKTAGAGEVTTVTVHPSARLSDRVPFGTGVQLQSLLHGENLTFPSPESRCALAQVLDRVENGEWKDLVDCLEQGPGGEFFKERNFAGVWQGILQNRKGHSEYIRAFHEWFDGLKTRQFLKKWPEVPYF